MREEEFKEWLEANGANTASGRATRSYAVRTVEENLQQLGFTYENLDEAWAARGFDDIRNAITELRDDYDAGGDRYKVLMPESEKPRRRLGSWRSWLGQYGRFLNGEGIGMQDADKIRHHVLENYIEPAREADEETVELVVKDVNDALGLNAAWPNICQALRGRKFLELAEVPPAQSFGADQSTATRFRFNVDQDDYWALRLLEERYGEPIAKTKKMAAFEVDDGRQVALDLGSARPQIWFEGDGFGANGRVYVPAAPRHSNLPPRLTHKGNNPRTVSLVTFANRDELSTLLDTYMKRGDERALDRLKAVFIEAFPSFEEDGGFVGSIPFDEQENRYKRALIDAARDAVVEMRDDKAALGGRLLDLIAGDGGLESNLLGWRMADGLRERRRAHPGLLEEAAADIALADDPQAAVIEFVERTWEPAFANEKSNPFSDSRTIPTLIAALTHPEEAIGLRTDRFNNLFLAIEGERLFGWSPLSRHELDVATAKAEEMFRVMRDEWKWAPRDLWDVQGFIWVACKDRLGERGELDPTPLWIVTARFGEEDGLPRFVERGEWSLLTDTGSVNNDRVRAMEVGDRIAMRDYFHQVHDLPFEANGGRVTALRFRALGTITEASEDGLRVGVEWDEWDEPRTWYFYTHNEPVWRLHDPGESAFADRLRRFLLEGVDQDYAWFLNDPYWRDRLFPDNTTKDQTMKPINLILYGPPGTGKTYRTASEAVRLCDGELPSGDGEIGAREALMQRYEELVEKERIAFVTFHQSFGYEDFVEGLRPTQEGEDGEAMSSGFRLAAEPGIFRSMAERAATLSQGQDFDLGDRRIFKMSLGEVANAADDYLFDEAIEGDFIHLGDDSEMDWSQPQFENKRAMIDAYVERYPDRDAPHPNSGVIDHAFTMRNRMREGDLIIVSKGNLLFRAIGEVSGDFHRVERENDDYVFRVPVKWLWVDPDGRSYDLVNEKRFSQKTVYELASSQIKNEALSGLISGGGSNGGEQKQFVLVIDEINRANISKVFGELITLIEPDKRLGMGNALTVTLPYSKREFGVPANLHLIGTMNTADRSIALLDTALRRRFRFEEMAPDAALLPDDVDGIPLQSVLETINARIEYLLDREHAIGHAFFMGEGGRDKAAIDDVMRFKVIPLLQEYFFEDWSRIHAVLGDGFITGSTLAPPPGIEDVGERKSWKVREHFDRAAYQALVGGNAADDEAQATE